MSFNLDDVCVGGQLKVGTGIVPASGRGGVITTLQSPWGRGRGEKRIRQILLDTMKTVPPPPLPR